MGEGEYFTIAQLAKILGISRIAVYKKVKNGQIKAIRIGRAFAIPKECLADILGETLSEESKIEIDSAVRKTVKEYGETLKLLSRE